MSPGLSRRGFQHALPLDGLGVVPWVGNVPLAGIVPLGTRRLSAVAVTVVSADGSCRFPQSCDELFDVKVDRRASATSTVTVR